MKQNFKFAFLSSNALKIIGAIFMAIDHIGFILFSNVEILRILGRLAMPIFAFCIAEGAYYTKNKLKYFLLMFGLGLVFQIVFYIVEQSLYLGILITFSTSILIIYALQFLKQKLLNGNVAEKVLATILFIFSILATYLLNSIFYIDYGFWGCILPVFASLCQFNVTSNTNGKSLKFNYIPLNVLTFAIGLILLCVSLKGIQYYALLALPILLLYSGKRGILKLKYFFYIFYPAHMVILYGIALLI